jgi:hypothetical protein
MSGRIMEFCRLFLAPYGSAGGVKDLFKGIREAGVTVIEDGSVPRRDLEAAMSRALTDLLQVHPLVDGPADPRVAGIVGRKGLGYTGCIRGRDTEARPDIGHWESLPSRRQVSALLISPVWALSALCWQRRWRWYSRPHAFHFLQWQFIVYRAPFVPCS